MDDISQQDNSSYVAPFSKLPPGQENDSPWDESVEEAFPMQLSWHSTVLVSFMSFCFGGLLMLFLTLDRKRFMRMRGVLVSAAEVSNDLPSSMTFCSYQQIDGDVEELQSVQDRLSIKYST